MNGEYIVTPGNVYYKKRPGGDKFKIDNQNVVSYKVSGGNTLEDFNEFIYEDNFSYNVDSFFNELGTKVIEKGNMILMKNNDGENIYIYNSLEPIPQLRSNEFIYSMILFENVNDLIRKKTEAICNFVFVNNISKISNLSKLETIRNEEQFIQNIGNPTFIDKDLKLVDDKLLEDIFLLGKGGYLGRWGKVYMYAFLESSGRLIPIIFSNKKSSDYSLDSEKVYDKLDIIYFLEGKNKISLLWEKIEESVCIFKEDVILKEDLQTFYNSLFKNNKLMQEEKEQQELIDFEL